MSRAKYTSTANSVPAESPQSWRYLLGLERLFDTCEQPDRARGKNQRAVELTGMNSVNPERCQDDSLKQSHQI